MIEKKGSAETLREYWTGHGHPGPTHGAYEKEIAWGTPGDFDRCVSLVTEHAKMSPEHAKGYCNLRHHEALGYWPAQHARMERGKADRVELTAGMLADIGKFNFNPAEPRTPGGTWTTGGGGAAAQQQKPPKGKQPKKPPKGKKPKEPKGRRAQEARLLSQARADAAEAKDLRARIKKLRQQLKALSAPSAASAGRTGAAAGASSGKTKPAATASGSAKKPAASSSAKKPSSSRASSSAAQASALRAQIAQLSARANQLDAQAAQLRSQAKAAEPDVVKWNPDLHPRHPDHGRFIPRDPGVDVPRETMHHVLAGGPAVQLFTATRDKETPLASHRPLTHQEMLHSMLAGVTAGKTANLVKVGPKGYVHGWKFVGVPGSKEHAAALGKLGDKLSEHGFPNAAGHVHRAAAHVGDAGKAGKSLDRARDAVFAAAEHADRERRAGAVRPGEVSPSQLDAAAARRDIASAKSSLPGQANPGRPHKSQDSLTHKLLSG